MGDILVVIIILAILGGAIYKLYWNKKNNIKCSGCPSCPLNGTCHSAKLKE
ncbi:MAG: FeoB-associated Cys-rich membrane protein [Clostridium sp.]|uniref:FeoB-associated Cys-rich membrane protein n=1 Tax=Clostridium sp. TaxID=1506 RepID=UPI003D6C8D31